MEVISRRTSSLNPNAPLFIPGAYRHVEDFSDEWWELVNSSAWFRDYWLQECFQDPQTDLDLDLDPVLLPDDIDSVFDGYTKQEEVEKDGYTNNNYYYRDLVTLGALKWPKSRGGGVETPKYSEKAPKFVNLKLNPRAIQQPR